MKIDQGQRLYRSVNGAMIITNPPPNGNHIEQRKVSNNSVDQGKDL
ncbi:hypothetical protein H6F44_19265 [Pseudanabaena sp. FACHB-1277]|uniref:Uncharacterized protein n=1 Tax=Pseudanabaena cinerea FACHB-1277 TaxID=2949581 RepID=A0A926Z7M4_9CYAN|nr:hypothetical protein [Pseudanabaena cinerea]MBD2152241.1 hypothetical protein [Pseudanabaena cinerea FACHB-1277]